jgi:Virulence-associated protein E-like domain
MAVTRLRPYKVDPKFVVSGDFFSADGTKNDDWCELDLAKSSLTPDDLLASAPGNLRVPAFALAGYWIPYYGTDGRVLTGPGSNVNTMWRLRLKLPEFSREARYLQPTKADLALSELPSYIPYLYPFNKDLNCETIYCIEGEKKTASAIKHCGVPAFGIAGCNMWGNPDGTGGVHPWIISYLKSKGAKRVCIIPDADIFRYDMCKAYGTYAAALLREGYEVELVHIPDKIDDLITKARSRGEFDPAFISSLPRIKPDELVQSPVQLARHYNLAFRDSDKGVKTVFQHTANIMKLLEEHSAFPKIWRNTDTNQVMVGDDPAMPDLTEMEIANYFQYNFGFDKVDHRKIFSCVQALAKRNQRSPFLDRIRSLKWDGVARLGTWLSRLWGVEQTDFLAQISTKWLTSACARMDKPGCKVDWMLIVVGEQGTGKTSMPNIMFDGNALTLYGEQNDKDLHMLLHSALCVGFDELDSFSRKESSTLKAMITRQKDAFRPPYGASVEEFPRRFTLYGCGNREEFLQHDPSGYRRYAIIAVHKLLDFSGLEAERDQLWAEAWHVYSHVDTKWWEIEGASENAEQYVAINLIAEEVNMWVSREFDNKTGNRVKDGFLSFTMTELCFALNQGNARNANVTREIAAELKRIGAVQKTVKKGMTTERRYFIPLPE